MAAYKYKSEEEHQLHLAWRRQYYHKNREKIRARDNASAKARKERNPEHAKPVQHKYPDSVRKPAPQPVRVDMRDNPERDDILRAIATEDKKSE